MAEIQIKNITIKYPIFTSETVSLKNSLIGKVGGNLLATKGIPVVTALKNITLSIKDGDRVALLGHNGAGKSTFLKVCSGIYEPTQGSVKIKGRISSMVGLHMGMDEEASGYENIYRRAIFMGLPHNEAQNLIEEVKDFSELGDFLHLPIRTYSTGMQTRLAFAIATSIVPDILIMDEMIGAGDKEFVEKAKERTRKIIDQSKIFVIASHNPAILSGICNKAIWLENGIIKKQGDFEVVNKEYLKK